MSSAGPLATRNGRVRRAPDLHLRLNSSRVKAPDRSAPQLDLRLLLPGLFAWAVVATALSRGVAAMMGAATVALAGGCLSAWLGRARHRRGATLLRMTALSLLAAAIGLAATAGHVASRSAGPLTGWAQERTVARIQALVIMEPIALGHGRHLLRARLVRADARGLRSHSSAPVLIVGDERWAALRWHDPISAVVRLRPADPGSDVIAVASPLSAPSVLREPSLLARGSEAVRARFRAATATLPADAAGLVPAMVFGDTSRLPRQLADDMRATGLAHLSAVSGANVTLLLAALAPVVRRLGVRRRARPLIALVALAAFVCVTRPEPSVIRAAAMGAIGVLGIYRSTRASGPPALAGAIIVLLCLDPWLSRSLGFGLSVLATLGLLVFLSPWSAALARHTPRRLAPLVPAVLTPVAAQVTCLPLLVGLQGGVSLIGVPANVLAGLCVGPVTVLGLLLAVWASVRAPPEVLAWLPGAPAYAIAEVAHRAAAVPGGTLPWPGQTTGVLVAILVLAVGLLCGARLRYLVRGHPRAASGVVALVAATVMPTAVVTWPPSGWQFVVCDVGQGDALVVRTGARSAVLVDTGPDPASADRCLRRLGIRRLDLLVLTHFHADHVAGTTRAVRGRAVRVVVISPVAQPQEVARELIDDLGRGGARVTVAAPGQRFSAGAADLTVLAPTRRIDAGSVPNNASVVLLADVGSLRLLLLGDIEREAGAGLRAALRRDAALAAAVASADVVKAAHHGSGNLDEGLLALLPHRLSVISVGAGNDYGHPSPRLLALLRGQGSAIWRTDERGSIAVWKRGRDLFADSEHSP